MRRADHDREADYFQRPDGARDPGGERAMSRPRIGGGNEDRRIKFDDDLLRLLHGDGKTIAEIAVIYGCSTHPVKMALQRLGLKRPARPRHGLFSGQCNPAWRGGRRQRTDGYIVIWTPEGERLEHRVVAEQILGRRLRRGEIVHHIDRDKTNNSPGNLEVMTQAEHAAHHSKELVIANGGHKGEFNPRAKLNWKQVREIQTSTESTRVLGRRFGVHHSTIGRIQSGEGWRND